MKRMNKQNLSKKLSLYIDAVLSEQEMKEMESLIEQDSSLRQEVEELRKVKQLLASKEVLTPHIGFWTRLSMILEDEKKEENSPLPFHRKYIPVIATLITMIIITIGIMIVQNRLQFLQFFAEKSHAVRDVYEKNVLQSSLLPLFSKVDKNQALQFSLFGTLPLDEKLETSLRIDANSKKGYRIDVGKDAQLKTKTITFDRFVAEVQPTKEQKKVIDSLLELSGKQIESSVLIGENNAVAIAPELPKLNRMMVMSIASCLEPYQRTKFEHFLAVHDAPYTIKSGIASVENAEQIFQKLPKAPRVNRYVVITPDTTVYSQINIDFDSLRRRIGENLFAIEFRRNELLKKMMTKKFRHAPQNIPIPIAPQVTGDEDFFSIEIDVPGEEIEQQSMHVIIQPRIHRQVMVPGIRSKPIRVRMRDDSASIDTLPIP
jgi:hypothetical protein